SIEKLRFNRSKNNIPMTHGTVELSIEAQSTRRLYAEKREEFIDKSKKFLRKILTRAFLALALAMLLYGIAYFYEIGFVAGHIAFLGSFCFFCYYGISFYDFKQTLKEWDTELDSFFKKYDGVDSIRYEYNDERFVLIARDEATAELPWTDVHSYR